MTELIALQGRHTCINIAEQIGIKWRVVGIALLQDRSGNIISSINEQYRGDILKINIEILQRWVNGQGIVDRTWLGLLGVLRVHCTALAQSVEEALNADETTNPPPTDQPQPPPPPPPPGPLRRFFRSLISCFQRQPHLPRPTDSPHTELSVYRYPTPQPELPPTVNARQRTHHLLPSSHSLECADPSPMDQTVPSPQPPPPCPPLQPQSAVWHFNAYLKNIYDSITDPVDTWPPSPSEKFINLAVITREKADSKKQYAFMLASLHGGVDEILETKAPVTIEKLLDMPTDKKLKCVLIEGAPGVGKSTFSWEICRRWAEGTIFQQFSLVLLLRLRDETVQNAQTIRDIVLYTVEEYLEEVSQYLQHTRGKHTLLILEGLDELPKHILTQPSIFTRLLDGTELPGAVILVTSRPSATPQIWQNWKKQISKHIEILGFTDQNMEDYVSSILGPEEIPTFYTYLCTAPSIRQLMYIPLHSGIAIELYRMSSDSDRPLPTTKTELYKALVHIILTRYLAKHPKYKDHEIEVKEFTDLPPDINTLFRELIQLAFDSLIQQQLIFKDKDRPIEHLGFMDVIAELFPFGRKVKFSYNFLHLSLQEYLAAVHVSLMDTGTQEWLLESLSTEPHLHNMGMFLAAITHFEGMDREVVKEAIQTTCVVVGVEDLDEDSVDEGDKKAIKRSGLSGSLILSSYMLQLVYEAKDVSLLEDHPHCTCRLSDYSPLVEFTALGYCMVNSSHKWSLVLGDDNQPMQSTQGIYQLVHTLNDNTNPSYTIHSMMCWYEETKIPQQLLKVLPQQTLPCIHTLILRSKTPQPLPQCLPQLVRKMNTLRVLGLDNCIADTLATTLQAVSTDNLEWLSLDGSQLTLAAMQACCSTLLRSSNTIESVNLEMCGISDELILCLVKVLPSLNKLYFLDLEYNAIEDEGFVALEEFEKTNEQVDLRY